jgi:hypothetical protein
METNQLTMKGWLFRTCYIKFHMVKQQNTRLLLKVMVLGNN